MIITKIIMFAAEVWEIRMFKKVEPGKLHYYLDQIIKFFQNISETFNLIKE